MQVSNSYHHVRFPIFKYLVGRGYDIIQKWLCLYSWFEQPYFTNHIWWLVGFIECALEASYCLEWFWICIFVAFLFALRNWGDWQPTHHINRLSSSYMPFSRTWDQVQGDRHDAKGEQCNVEQIYGVGCFWMDKHTHWWNSFGHTEETRQSRNYNCKLINEIHVRLFEVIYINTTDRQHAPNCQQRTS